MAKRQRILPRLQIEEWVEIAVCVELFVAVPGEFEDGERAAQIRPLSQGCQACEIVGVEGRPRRRVAKRLTDYREPRQCVDVVFEKGEPVVPNNVAIREQVLNTGTVRRGVGQKG